ncbi:MAG TPA: TIGR00730 family Rossman fold protein [bacterium]|nr:TIGR00730 family Rossman fold protein [bacterium]HPN31911.1 TIGR00730 family Rossman fold protein [bacterium]
MAEFNNICVYCSSSNAVDKSYYNSTEELGSFIGTTGKTLVYGGAKIGLMGALADSVKNNSGKIIGVIPEYLNDAGISYKNCDELIITKDLRERKKIMESLADAFIVLPGGYGTLEEFVEILTLKQLKTHNKPIIIINTNNFYGKLFDFFDHLYSQNFTHSDYRGLYFTAGDIKKAWDYLENYVPLKLKDKWFVS